MYVSNAIGAVSNEHGWASSPVGAVAGNFLVQTDGTSLILLVDGTSALLLAA